MKHPFPWTTGETAAFLECIEPRLGELIRRGRVPRPLVRSGRRLWTPEAVILAGEALGVLTPDKRQALEEVALEALRCHKLQLLLTKGP